MHFRCPLRFQAKGFKYNISKDQAIKTNMPLAQIFTRDFDFKI